MKKKKRKQLTPQQQAFLDAYSKNAGNILATCNDLNITTARAAQVMEHPLVKEHMSRSVQTAKEQIAAAAPHLVSLAMEMLNNPDISPKIKASLIDSLLDRAGVTQPKTPPIAISINTEISDRARALLAAKLEEVGEDKDPVV